MHCIVSTVKKNKQRRRIEIGTVLKVLVKKGIMGKVTFVSSKVVMKQAE